MNKSRILLLVSVLLCSAFTKANALDEKVNLSNQLMTPRDILTNAFSNVVIQNKMGSSVQVFGLYINTLASTSNSSCAAPTVLYTPAGTTPVGGAFVTSIPTQPNQSLHLGQNYLYNMMLTAIYYTNQQASASPCTLPGCTWFTDTAPPSKWCVYVGVISPSGSNTASTSSVPPFSASTHGAGYNYDLVTNYNYIGPITCDDQKLTCAVTNVQTQAFPG